MELIPYEQFSINENTLNKLNEHYVNRKISEYFTKHGQLPDSGTMETYTIPSELMDRYKKYYYSEYYKKEWELEKEYGPSEMIETSFDFSPIEDNDSTVLGSPSLRLGAGNNEYQYGYWSIIVYSDDYSGDFFFGEFSSLNGAKLSLNTIKTYTIHVYHRKSNYQYSGLTWSMGYSGIDNTFHKGGYHNHDISSYRFADDIGYQTQLEDKEYIGAIYGYKPQRGKSITGTVHTLNPRLTITVSGLTQGFSVNVGNECGGVTFSCNEEGQFSTNGDISKLTKLNDTSFTYLMTKDELIATLWFEEAFVWGEGNTPIDSTSYYFYSNFWWELPIPGMEGYSESGEIRMHKLYRSRQSSGITINIPPHAEIIDNGFDFGVVDDESNSGGTVNNHEYSYNVISSDGRFMLSSSDIKNNEIIYTSTNESIVTPYYNNDNTFGTYVEILSNTYENGVGVITLSNEATIIRDNAFKGCNKLKNIILPNSVVEIENNAFDGCDSLYELIIGSGLTAIGENICGDPSYIKVSSENEKYDSREDCNAIIESDNNTIIYGCKNSTIPQSVTTIGKRAFFKKQCNAINAESIITIEDDAFEQSGIKEITVSDKLKYIGDGAFFLTPLDSINLPISVEHIGIAAFSNISGNQNMSFEFALSAVPENCFCAFLNLTAITLNDTVKQIGSAAFASCWNLTRINIPDGITVIENQTFDGCKSLSEITIPSSVTSISTKAFWNCTRMEKIVCLPPIPPSIDFKSGYSSIGTWWFNDDPFGGAEAYPIYVPDSLVELYKENWQIYSDRILPMSVLESNT